MLTHKEVKQAIATGEKLRDSRDSSLERYLTHGIFQHWNQTSFPVKYAKLRRDPYGNTIGIVLVPREAESVPAFVKRVQRFVVARHYAALRTNPNFKHWSNNKIMQSFQAKYRYSRRLFKFTCIDILESAQWWRIVGATTERHWEPIGYWQNFFANIDWEKDFQEEIDRLESKTVKQ